MAKMFYSIEETAERLGVSADQVKAMAEQGKLQQFRDGAKVMFKRDQVEAMAGGDSGDSGVISLDGPSLSDDTDAIDLSSVTDEEPTDKPKSATATGISVFDADEVEMADPMAQTVVSGGMDSEADDLVLESVGSGSGLLDLTRESDDTSLGAELLDEIYPAGSDAKDASSVGSIFEQAGGGMDTGPEPAMGGGMVSVIETEATDPAGSGLAAGLLIGAVAALVIVAMIIYGVITEVQLDLTAKIAENMPMYAGGLAGVTIIFGAIGFFVGKSMKR